MFDFEALIRWSQYSWDNQEQYFADLEYLGAVYQSLLVERPVFTGTLYRAEESAESLLELNDGSSLCSDKKHECWTKCICCAKRFLVFRGGYLLKGWCHLDSDILFDVEVLCNALPSEVREKYTDLQDLEREVVLRRNSVVRHSSSLCI